MGRGGRGDSADVARGSVHDAWRVLDGRAAGVGDSETDSETASADLGRGDQSYNLRAGCRSRARRVVFHARGRAAAGGGANQYLSRGNQEREAVLWYVRKGFELVSSVAAASKTDESYQYLKTAAKFDPAKFTDDYYDFLKDGDLIAVGAADEAVRVARRYRDLGA